MAISTELLKAVADNRPTESLLEMLLKPEVNIAPDPAPFLGKKKKPEKVDYRPAFKKMGEQFDQLSNQAGKNDKLIDAIESQKNTVKDLLHGLPKRSGHRLNIVSAIELVRTSSCLLLLYSLRHFLYLGAFRCFSAIRT